MTSPEVTQPVGAPTTHPALISRVITHQLPAARIADALDLFLSEATGKVVVTQELDS